jgi:hypothetical protein
MFALRRQPSKFAFAVILTIASSSANARELPVEMGLVTCSYAASSTPPDASDLQNVIGGKRDIACSFRLGLHGPDETYVGTLQYVGKADQVLGKGALMFVAKAPRSLKTTVGMMEGRYTTRALTPSGTQRPLIRESKATVILHPLDHTYERATLALGGMPSLIVLLELKLKAAPA